MLPLQRGIHQLQSPPQIHAFVTRLRIADQSAERSLVPCRPSILVEQRNWYYDWNLRVRSSTRWSAIILIVVRLINRFDSGISATMRVYRDFFSYQRGIYKHSAANRGEPSGFHSVRLVGWGEEHSRYSSTKYWVSRAHHHSMLSRDLWIM